MPVQELLTTFFVREAAFRLRMVKKYPHDLRNQRSADALRDLAAFVGALPDDDPRLAAVRDLMSGDVEYDIWRNGLGANDAAPTYPAVKIGFHHRPVDCDKEFSAYIGNGLRDQVRWLERDAKDDPEWRDELGRVRGVLERYVASSREVAS